jgi:hypothetical protein
MRSDVIVIASLGSQDVAQMRLAQDDNPYKQRKIHLPGLQGGD